MNKIKAENGIGPQYHNVRLLGVLLLFLVIPVILFWRRDLFFILDDLTLIHQMDGNSVWIFSRMADCEMIMPVSRSIYYTLVQLFGANYGLLILINSLITGLNAFLLYLIFKNHFKPNLAFALSFLYVVAAVHSATAQMAYYICAILCLSFFFIEPVFYPNLRSPTVDHELNGDRFICLALA